ncbi:MAG: hypothetical protein WBQ86_04785 [Candidatus Binatus sp.]
MRGSSKPKFPTCEGTADILQTTTTATDLFDPATTEFTAAGALNQSRGGYAYGVLNARSHSGDLVVIGGECAAGTLASAPIGTSAANPLCGSSGEKDYYELFSPSTGDLDGGSGDHTRDAGQCPSLGAVAVVSTTFQPVRGSAGRSE